MRSWRRREALKLAGPVILTPPTDKQPVWWAKSNAQNRPLREDVALSPATGEVMARNTFGEKHIIDQIVGVGIAAHEGQLFAPLNQILGVLTALGLVTLCVSRVRDVATACARGRAGRAAADSGCEGRLGAGGADRGLRAAAAGARDQPAGDRRGGMGRVAAVAVGAAMAGAFGGVTLSETTKFRVW